MDTAKTTPSILTIDLKTVAIKFDLTSPPQRGRAAGVQLIELEKIELIGIS